jgi:MazG family protein
MNDEEMVSPGPDADQIGRLRAIMHRLRAPGGCPWDAEQSHESLIANLVEETYETIDAIRSGDTSHLCEELGDLLLQVVFHAELAGEAGRFTLDDVARGISDKLVRRHPHVFGNADAADPDAVLRRWDEIKRAERGDSQQPFLHGVGKGLPALPRAAKLQKKAAKAGFDWPDEAGVLAKVREELAEVEAAAADGDPDAFFEELGDLLFSIVNLARFRKIDPEVLMAAANAKFEHRFHAMERRLDADGTPLGTADLSRMEAAWQAAKSGGVPS